jgi:monovalent cation/hydrogen antiporter
LENSTIADRARGLAAPGTRVSDIEFVFLLFIAAAALVAVANGMNVPAPIVLVVGGLAIALIPGLPRITLAPDVVFFGFLPPLVYAAGFEASPHELRAVLRPLAFLALGLVFVTAAVVAAVAHTLVPGFGWPAAAVLGAALAPTDAVSAQATFRRLGAPTRLSLLAQGEAVFNDASGLVLYKIAVGAATGAGFGLGHGVLVFLATSLGGAGVGIVVALITGEVFRHERDVSLVIVLSVLSGYGAYIAAEELHASGVIAAVTAGVAAGWSSPRTLDADTRLTAEAFWRVTVFALEMALFVLLGLQLPIIVDNLSGSSAGLGELVWPTVAIAGASTAARLLFVLAMRSDSGDSAGERFALGWSGMRGAVSLAAALAVPLAVGGRPEIVVIAFGTILLTLVGHGLTLPLVVHGLRLEQPRRWTEEEMLARAEATQNALDRLDELEEEGADEEQLRRLRELYRRRFREIEAVLGGESPDEAEREERLVSYGRLRRELIAVERETLLELRARGRLGSRTLRVIQRDLDLEDARVRV